MSQTFVLQREALDPIPLEGLQLALVNWLESRGASLTSGTFGALHIDWRVEVDPAGNWECLLRVEDDQLVARHELIALQSAHALAIRFETQDPRSLVSKASTLPPSPTVVADLLDLIGRARPEVTLASVEQLLGVATREPDGVPLIIVSGDDPAELSTKRQLEAIKAHVEGMAIVALLPTIEVSAICQRFGLLGDGRAGTSLLIDPDAANQVVDYPSSVAIKDPYAIARRLQAAVVRRASIRPPEVLAAARSRLGLGAPGLDQKAAEKLLDESVADITQLSDSRDMAYLEIQDLESQISSLLSLNLQLQRAVWAAQAFGFLEEHPEDEEVDLESCADALKLVSDVLPFLVVTADISGAEDLDRHPAAGAWAGKAWRLLRGLNGYAHSKSSGEWSGNLEMYCKQPPPKYAPLPAKSFAPRESESTMANPGLAAVRRFGVPDVVSPTREAVMAAHLKIDNSPPAPRIHFYDDTGGPTGKVYIGYFGKHLPTSGS